MDGLLRIGDLARLGGVSIKALRFYDEQGLLRPDYVDPQSGYRYYSVDQMQTLAMIANLRAVDFTIREIAAILAAPPEPAILARAIQDKKAALRREQAALDEKLRVADLLAAAARAGRDIGAPLRLAQLEDQCVYATVKTVGGLGRDITNVFETTEAIVAAAGARAPRSPFMIFHDPPDKPRDLKVEICIPINGDADDFANAKRFPGGGYALSTVYRGGYAKTEPLYRAMTDWAARAQLPPLGALREVYHRFGADQDDYDLPAKMVARRAADYLTELVIPISLPDHNEAQIF